MTSADAIRDELERFKDQYRLVQNSIGGSCGNGLCLTGESIVMLKRRHFITDFDRADFKKAVAACETAPGSGCLRRHPDRWHEQNGPDDYYGVAVGSIILKTPEIPKRILEYGRKHKFHPAWTGSLKDYCLQRAGILLLGSGYYYPDEHPDDDHDSRAWLGRQIGLIGLLKLGAGEGLPWASRKVLNYAVAHTGDSGPSPRTPGGQDAWRISDMVAEVLIDQGADSREAVREFERRYQATWPTGGRQEMYEHFFGGKHWLSEFSLPISTGIPAP